MKKLLITALVTAGLFASLPAMAQNDGDMSEAEVRRIAGDRVTLRHGPIDNLKMPPMTMVFRAEPTKLEGLEVGDKVLFRAEQEDGSYVVTEIGKADAE